MSARWRLIKQRRRAFKKRDEDVARTGEAWVSYGPTYKAYTPVLCRIDGQLVFVGYRTYRVHMYKWYEQHPNFVSK